MAIRVLALTALGAILWLSACREPVAPPPAVPSVVAPVVAPAAPVTAASGGHAITIKARIHPDLPEASFTLVADSAPEPAGVLHVRAIEIRRGNVAEPAQRIEGLATDSPWSATAPPFEVLDMNFDGYGDIRLVGSRPAGPNVPYLNWLYDPASGRFVESRALNEITSPRFDSTARELRSDWRDSATRYGTDIYAFREGQLLPLRREAKNYKRPGEFTLQVSRWTDGAWRVVETREGRDR
jgi:hypothetical protein